MKKLAVLEKVNHDKDIQDKGSQAPQGEMGVHDIDFQRDQSGNLDNGHVLRPAEPAMKPPCNGKVDEPIDDSPDGNDQEHVGPDQAGLSDKLSRPSIIDVDIEILRPVIEEMVQPDRTKGETSQSDHQGKKTLRNTLEDNVF